VGPPVPEELRQRAIHHPWSQRAILHRWSIAAEDDEKSRSRSAPVAGFNGRSAHVGAAF
jgi:hypothetical protein